MTEKLFLRRTIKKSAKGDFSLFMAHGGQKDVVRVLQYAAKKANKDQQNLVKTSGLKP